MKLRLYQEQSRKRILRAWARGKRPLLVLPTGAGKTRVAIAAIKGKRTCWAVHRREIIEQTAATLKAMGFRVCMIMGGESDYIDPHADVYCGTIQTLLERIGIPRPEVLVLDEAHHYPEDNYWHGILKKWSRTPKLLGLTATPERLDGRAMGDVFDQLIVGASYSDLFRHRYLIRPYLYRASTALGQNLAIDPVLAVRQYCQGLRTFLFVPRVDIALQYRERLQAMGTAAEVISHETPSGKRSFIMERFRTNIVQVIVNVDTMTEGIDVPSASACVLARKYGHPSGLIQATGRILRPAPEKEKAIIVDLTGTTITHGYPCQDWKYSLEGQAIQGEGMGFESTVDRENPTIEQTILNQPLIAYGNAPEVSGLLEPDPREKQRNAYDALLLEAFSQGKGKRWAAGQYRAQHGQYPPGYLI